VKPAASTTVPGLRLPIAPRSIQKGGTLNDLLDREAIACLAHNLSLAHLAFDADPRPTLPILQALKDDLDPYVRRSVVNPLGDIAKDHPALAFQMRGRWLESATPERCWLIGHAVRHPAKKGVAEAIRLRQSAR
jgi:3-methyladenine DNA glycosylase AlkC